MNQKGLLQALGQKMNFWNSVSNIDVALLNLLSRSRSQNEVTCDPFYLNFVYHQNSRI